MYVIDTNTLDKGFGFHAQSVKIFDSLKSTQLNESYFFSIGYKKSME